MNKVLLATRNRKKLVELQRVLDGALGAHRSSCSGWTTSSSTPSCRRPA